MARWGGEDAAIDVRLVAVAVALLCTAFALPLMTSGFGETTASFTAWSVTSLRAMVLAAVVSALVGLAVARANPGAGRLALAFVGCWSALGALLLGLTAETISATFPRGALPGSLRRLTAQVGAGPGLWLIGIAGLLLVLAAVGPPPLRAPMGGGVRIDRTLAPAMAALVFALGLTVARYQPWIEVGGTVSDGSIPGWSLPWLGPLFLIGLWMCLLGALASWFRVSFVVDLIAAVGAWMVLAASVGSIAFARTVGVRSLEVEVEGRELMGTVSMEPTIWPVVSVGLALVLWALGCRRLPRRPIAIPEHAR